MASKVLVQLAQGERDSSSPFAPHRQRLQGTVTAVKSGVVMAEVEVRIEPGSVVAAITDHSRTELGLAEGDRVTVIIKSTDVPIGK
jgi:molybdopterin-binding protein